MELDFRQCKTEEDVEKVFKKKKPEFDALKSAYNPDKPNKTKG